MAKGTGIWEKRRERGHGYEPFEHMMKRFQKRLDREGIREKAVEKMYFEKPSVKKRRKIKENKYWQKREDKGFRRS